MKQPFAEEPMPDNAAAAATLVVMQPSPGGRAADILMVKRSPKMAFAAGAIVFPGGRVDPDDGLLGAKLSPGLHPADAAARVAAIRETLEETGLAIGFANIEQARVHQLRAGLSEAALFSDLLAGVGLAPDLEAVRPFARWCPNLRETRTFDTRFYVAEAPRSDIVLSVDATENTHFFWDSAQSALDRADAGEISVIFPTRRNLERLVPYRSAAELIADAAVQPIRTITPWIETRDGESHLCIPDGSGYPVLSEPLAAAVRG